MIRGKRTPRPTLRKRGWGTQRLAPFIFRAARRRERVDFWRLIRWNEGRGRRGQEEKKEKRKVKIPTRKTDVWGTRRPQDPGKKSNLGPPRTRSGKVRGDSALTRHSCECYWAVTNGGGGPARMKEILKMVRGSYSFPCLSLPEAVR